MVVPQRGQDLALPIPPEDARALPLFRFATVLYPYSLLRCLKMHGLKTWSSISQQRVNPATFCPVVFGHTGQAYRLSLPSTSAIPAPSELASYTPSYRLSLMKNAGVPLTPLRTPP